MSEWHTHVTVACVVLRQERYLMVEERDKRTGRMVFNQPAGHLEAGETLPEAALREVLEETGWHVRLTGVLGLGLYALPDGSATYLRTTFIAQAEEPVANAVIDPDIHKVHWLEYGEILAISDKLRSPLVLDVIERQRRGLRFPLDVIHAP
ncbi:MAG: NUDIX hydrolase [Halioglobus sp.]|nr:NUDIX hydrolase [Halioglobus sp.]